MKKYWVDSTAGTIESVSHNYTPSLTARSAYFYLQAAGHFLCDKNYYTKREGYRSFLLIYTVSGKGHANYRNRSYELEKGQMLLMDCYDYQEYNTGVEETWEIKWLHFNGSTSLEYFNTIYDCFGPVLSTYGDTPIESYIDEIFMLIRENDMKFEIKLSRLIVGILTEILLAGSQGNDVKITDVLVQPALDFIALKYMTDITLKDMAAAACCSEFHFSRVFKKVTGYCPHEYLIKLRINEAKNLLKHTTRAIDDIAAEIGFRSTSNFIRTFKELEEITPLKYRNYWVG